MVRGPIVMQGYFGNAEATRETIEPDGWLHTGDVAHMDADGYIYVVDRKKAMIITAATTSTPPRWSGSSHSIQPSPWWR